MDIVGIDDDVDVFGRRFLALRDGERYGSRDFVVAVGDLGRAVHRVDRNRHGAGRVRYVQFRRHPEGLGTAVFGHARGRYARERRDRHAVSVRNGHGHGNRRPERCAIRIANLDIDGFVAFMEFVRIDDDVDARVRRHLTLRNGERYRRGIIVVSVRHLRRYVYRIHRYRHILEGIRYIQIRCHPDRLATAIFGQASRHDALQTNLN